jgi:hypothetical protein
MTPKLTDLDAYIKKKHGHFLKPEVDEAITPPKQSIELKPSPQKQADTPTPTPRKRPTSTPTPVPRINLFSPAKHIGNFKPQNIFSPATPILDISKAGRTNLMEPIESTLKRMMAGDRIKAMIKRNSVQRDLKEVNQEANKLQNAFRNFKAKKTIRNNREEKHNSPAPAKMELGNTVQPARSINVHERTRQGAATTRTVEKNQAIDQLRQQPPARQSSVTEISNAVTTSPQATKAKVGRSLGSGTPKPMRIKYDKPGRPELMPDPEGPASEPKTPKLRLPKKK